MTFLFHVVVFIIAANAFSLDSSEKSPQLPVEEALSCLLLDKQLEIISDEFRFFDEI